MNNKNSNINLWLPSSILIIFGLIIPVYLALLTPIMGIQFKVTDSPDSLKIVQLSKPHFSKGQLAKDDLVFGIKAQKKSNFTPINAQTLIEEPDVIVEFSDFNYFFQQQNKINNILQNETIILNTSQGDISIKPRARLISELPFSFWFQIICGIFTSITALSMYAFNKSSQASKSLWVTGFSFYIVTLAAAPYSSRELVMDGTIFNLLCNANHFGSLLFTAGFASLFWNYPVTIKKTKSLSVLTLLVSIYLLIWLGDISQILINNDFSLRWPILIGLLISITLACIQYYKVRKNPVDRAAMKWLFFSIILTGSAFVFINIASHLVNINVEITQAYAFGILTLMYIGLAFGVSRYKLFQLETWWTKIWLWLMIGLLILILDSFIIYMLNVSQTTSLITSLALIGWLYFPLRQLILKKLFLQKEQIDEDLLSDIVSVGIAWSNPEKFKQLLFNTIDKLFSPLQIELNSISTPLEIEVNNNGTSLFTPSINGLSSLKISMPHNGKKLFTQKDQLLLKQVFNLLTHVVDSHTSFQQGQNQERSRIYSDLHDDLGAKLLSMTYRAKDDESADLARSALQDLRDVVSRSSNQSVTLNELMADWHAETENRLESANINLDWLQNDDIDEKITSSLWALNLGRIIREAITNIIKHTNTKKVIIRVNNTKNNYEIIIEDFDTNILENIPFSGRGISNMKARSKKLGGSIEWATKKNGGCIVTLNLNLENT